MKQITMNEDCQFLKDLEDTSNNFMGTNKGMYNLIVIKGQLKLYSKGIKPSRHWRVTDVKNYLGLKGSTSSLLEQTEQLYKIITKSV